MSSLSESSCKLHVSHAPFWHNGSSVSEKNYHILLACLPAVIPGIILYGRAAVGVVTLAIASAIIWELIFNIIAKQKITVGNGSSALIGLLLAMMLPATTPWWTVVCGTFFAVIIGKEIFGGLGANPFNPIVLAITILTVSWGDYLDFNRALLDYQFEFNPIYPLTLAKVFGSAGVDSLSLWELFLGNQPGGIGSTCGIGLLIGGVYLIVKGFIRWEISVSFLAGIFLTAAVFRLLDPDLYAGPGFHLVTGYSLIGAFFLATEDSSSPVNPVPMILYGLLGGILTVMIRNIGIHVNAVPYAILLINLVNPLLDQIKVVKKSRQAL